MSGQQNPHMTGTDSPMTIPTGLVAIDVSSTDQALDPWCRGIDCVTAGNVALVMSDGSTGVIPMTAGARWTGHIKQITKTGTTITGYALK